MLELIWKTLRLIVSSIDLNTLLSHLAAIIIVLITAFVSLSLYFKRQRWEYKVKAYTEFLASFTLMATHAHDNGGEDQQTAQRDFFAKISTVLPFADKGVVDVLASFMRSATNKNIQTDPRPFEINLIQAMRKDLGVNKLDDVPDFLYVVGERKSPDAQKKLGSKGDSSSASTDIVNSAHPQPHLRH